MTILSSDFERIVMNYLTLEFYDFRFITCVVQVRLDFGSKIGDSNAGH